MRHLYFFLAALAFALFTCCGQVEEAEVGRTLPDWQEGELDIHFINTGRGECSYLIFPDGTTFLVDASGALKNDIHGLALLKPNADVTAGQAIVDYVNHFSPAKSKGHINYFLLTHHHGDHMGTLDENVPSHSSNEFRLSSVCEIGSELIMDKIFDRDPDFSFPKEATGEVMTNYQNFLKWTERTNSTKIEKWAVGSSSQVVPLYDDSYDFVVRNVAGNGCAATEDGECVSYMPPKSEFEAMDKNAYPDENCLSCAYMLSYGKFDFFAGGDLQFWGRHEYSYKDAETPLLPVVYKVEVMKANHHGCGNANCKEFLAKLCPDVWLDGVWTNIIQPGHEAMENLLGVNPKCELFFTYQSDDSLKNLEDKIGADFIRDNIKSRYGHIVVRVAPGGDSYMVYTLEDSDEEYTVKSIHGPYACGD